jgi:hypothetical protein
MAKKTIKTKYGTKINVEGLTDEQIKKVRSVAEDNGAYGAKGAALAKELQTKNQEKANAPATQPPAVVAQPQPQPAPTVPTAPKTPPPPMAAAGSVVAPPASPAPPKSITTKYGTKINVEGLTNNQIERVRSIAEDNGAYGGKGKALAEELKGKNDRAGSGVATTQPVGSPVIITSGNQGVTTPPATLKTQALSATSGTPTTGSQPPKTITTKYGTKINVEGLTDEQIKKVRSAAEDNGAYGGKGKALAETLQKKNASGQGTPVTDKPSTGGNSTAPRTITTKYGTKINVEGLTDAQIERVRSIAEDNGAYGTKGAALAKELQGKNKKRQEKGQPPPNLDPNPDPNAGGGVVTDKGPGRGSLEDKISDLGVKKGGTIDGGRAADVLVTAENSDATRTFNMNNPKSQKDALGNERVVTVDPKTGEVSTQVNLGTTGTASVNLLNSSINNAAATGNVNLSNEIGKINNAALDLSAAPRILDSNDVRTEAQKVGDANYNYLTRNFERDKRRELEATKQELANRGIPIDFGNADSMWNKAVGSIDQKYQDADLAASNQALMSRDQSMATLAGVQTGARDAFVKSAQAQFDATTGTAKDSAGLKTTQAAAGQNQLNNAIGAVGATTGDFTAYAGGSVDNSGMLANLIGQMSDAELTRYGIDKDYAAKMKAIATQGRNSGGGGGGNAGGGFTIGGVAP